MTLISARGATGKSTVAMMIAAEKKVPLRRLDADLSVSGHAVESKLNHYIGGASAVAKFMNSADGFIVIDSLDEARMRVLVSRGMNTSPHSPVSVLKAIA